MRREGTVTVLGLGSGTLCFIHYYAIRLFLIILPIMLSVFPHYAQSKNEKIVMDSPSVVTDIMKGTKVHNPRAI